MTRTEYVTHLTDELRPRCRGTLSDEGRKWVLAALEAGDRDKARRLDAKHRDRCGHPLAAAMLARPLDGKPKETKCPVCGNVFRWAPPKIED